MSDEKVYGFSRTAKVLESAISTSNSPILFYGKDNIGKFTLVSSIAGELVSAPENIHVLNVQEGKTQISIEQVRTLLDDIKLVPFGSDKFRAVIVDGAQHLNNVSENAMLKLLEEPPEYVRIFLIADSLSSVLPTIRSRCMTIHLYHAQEDIDRTYDELGFAGNDFLKFVYRDRFGKIIPLKDQNEQQKFDIQKQIVESLPKITSKSEVIKYQKLFQEVNTIETLKMAFNYYRPKIQPNAGDTYEYHVMVIVLDALTSLSSGLNEKLVIDLLISKLSALNNKWYKK